MLEGMLVDTHTVARSFEEIYGGMDHTKPPPRPGKGGRIGEFKEPPPPDPNSQKQPGQPRVMTENDWGVATVQVSRMIGRGKLPAFAKALVDELTDTRVPWQTVLADFVMKTARDDYNWSVPAARHLVNGVFLPSLRSEELPPIVVAIDTSGSMWGELQEFLNAINEILAAYPTTIHALMCDTEVNDEKEYTQADLPIVCEKKGCGGTNFAPVFEWVETHDVMPACLIYLTDLDGGMPSVHPDYPVMWVVKKGCTREAPFGEIVEVG
jgi:predicted metal-dependent peptidase